MLLSLRYNITSHLEAKTPQNFFNYSLFIEKALFFGRFCSFLRIGASCGVRILAK